MSADDENDILWGAEAIAREIQRPMRATFHMLHAGLIPARKVGRNWCASRAKLRAALTGEPVGVEPSTADSAA